ncbi:AAA family ATPase [Heyndrickxia oleronia]|jgi:adenylate kinase family enzyme|nr:AAA family ATPase [Heyndrickxia oleronia]MBU5210468.1 AAA family ATPase [Heyndrickxia oleronia]MCM3453680.1 AAA family ATPase [Heyndrickxia oleronia]NYV64851.1 AAA family ATPase [Bacillus sp. Gen3]OJH19345.1 tunicamycin resistance protein [Bacillus obstructivus]
MIIMINGAFGVGKTSVANELVKQMDNSMIFDPEEVGFMLRNIIPNEIKQKEANTGDFQDLQLWKELTVVLANRLIQTYKMNLIIPMTIRKQEYLHYIIDGFKKLNQDPYHFCLIAEEETIYERLRRRGEEEGNWCFQQTRKCINAFNTYDFGEYIQTDHLSIPLIVEIVKEKVSL